MLSTYAGPQTALYHLVGRSYPPMSLPEAAVLVNSFDEESFEDTFAFTTAALSTAAVATPYMYQDPVPADHGGGMDMDMDEDKTPTATPAPSACHIQLDPITPANFHSRLSFPSNAIWTSPPATANLDAHPLLSQHFPEDVSTHDTANSANTANTVVTRPGTAPTL
jgi:hypothetical protein